MNILTKNRIIEKGDEYRNGEGWKTIPDRDIGLQIRFTDYKEVRRPTESPKPEQGSQVARQGSAKPSIAGSTPAPASESISPTASNTKEAQGTASPKATVTAEAKPVPASGVSPAGGESLPTVISKKAHEKSGSLRRTIFAPGTPARGIPKHPIATGARGITRHYTDLSAIPNWIGRNGTFKQTGVMFQSMPNGLIQIRPVGKRGVGKNALIEIPRADLAPLVRWLEGEVT